jgi:sodium transport system permease protein
MTSPSRPRTPRLYHAARGPSLSATGALLLVLAAIATLIAVGQIAVSLGAPLYAAMALGQLGMLALALGVLRAARLPPRALGIAAAPARFLAAGVLIGASAWYLNLALVDALVTVEQGELETMQRMVERPALGAVLLAIAIAPAVCEEVLFRGALLRGLAARISPAAALVAASAMFSIYHFKPVQMLPTFTLGLVLGVLSLRAGSILPSVIAHFLNNAMAIVVQRQESEPLSRGLAEHPRLALAGFGALFVVGTAVAVATPIAGGRGAAPAPAPPPAGGAEAP